MTSPALQASALSRRYGSHDALCELSLEVPPGRVVALLGPNGAGKTTLLKLLLGLLEPTSGSSRVLGEPSRALPPPVSCRIAAIIDGHEPPPWATVARLLDLQASAASDFDRNLAEGLLRDRRLSKNDRYGALSKGQKRWTLAALTLATRADLLLLDEPADGLDPEARRELYDRVRDLVTERNATALVATHIIGDIERVADDVAMINRGRLVLHEPLDDLRDSVRLLELPDDGDALHALEGVEVLHREQPADTSLAWIRCDPDTIAAIKSRLHPAPRTWTVNLESLYLAVVKEQQALPQETSVEVRS